MKQSESMTTTEAARQLGQSLKRRTLEAAKGLGYLVAGGLTTWMTAEQDKIFDGFGGTVATLAGMGAVAWAGVKFSQMREHGQHARGLHDALGAASPLTPTEGALLRFYSQSQYPHEVHIVDLPPAGPDRPPQQPLPPAEQ